MIPIIGHPAILLDSGRTALQVLGLWPAPRSVALCELVAAVCPVCRSTVHYHQTELVTLDLEKFNGLELLSLHPCCHEIGPDDLDDPDWGWIR